MLFNDPTYILFLGIVYTIYWGVSRRVQNILLLAVSYLFYSCWSVRLLPLILISSLSAFCISIVISSTEDTRQQKYYLWLGLLINFVFLFIFKYYNFFAESFAIALESINVSIDPVLLNVILPVGISFYTFQSASYIIDVYNKRIEACLKPIDFLLYISFFPQLVAGPIERASNMLPQFSSKRTFSLENFRYGIAMITYGIFKKVVIADNLSIHVDKVFGNIGEASGLQLVIATFFFSFQIYCDFSGYSDVAVGSGRILGFRLSNNFLFPYFSSNPAEFWRKWHVTLMSWFRDYIYIPIGGSRRGIFRARINLLIVFLVSGLWHGANWTFVVWGGLNGFLIVCYLGVKTFSDSLIENYPLVKRIAGITITYISICITWVFFRVDSVSEGIVVLKTILQTSLFSGMEMSSDLFKPLVLVFLFVITELVIVNSGENNFRMLTGGNRLYVVCLGVICFVTLFGAFRHAPFIYFQF